MASSLPDDCLRLVLRRVVAQAGAYFVCLSWTRALRRILPESEVYERFVSAGLRLGLVTDDWSGYRLTLKWLGVCSFDLWGSKNRSYGGVRHLACFSTPAEEIPFVIRASEKLFSLHNDLTLPGSVVWVASLASAGIPLGTALDLECEFPESPVYTTRLGASDDNAAEEPEDTALGYRLDVNREWLPFEDPGSDRRACPVPLVSSAFSADSARAHGADAVSLVTALAGTFPEEPLLDDPWPELAFEVLGPEDAHRVLLRGSREWETDLEATTGKKWFGKLEGYPLEGKWVWPAILTDAKRRRNVADLRRRSSNVSVESEADASAAGDLHELLKSFLVSDALDDDADPDAVWMPACRK